MPLERLLARLEGARGVGDLEQLYHEGIAEIFEGAPLELRDFQLDDWQAASRRRFEALVPGAAEGLEGVARALREALGVEWSAEVLAAVGFRPELVVSDFGGERVVVVLPVGGDAYQLVFTDAGGDSVTVESRDPVTHVLERVGR